MDDDATLVVLPGSALPSTADELTHVLVLLEEGLATRRIPIGPQPLTIGRVRPCDLVIEGHAISRSHCRVQLEGDDVVLTDLNSTNGTFVDGRRIAGAVPLQHGSVLQIGSCTLNYERRTQREIREAAAIERDLQSASAYVQMLLPKQLHEGPIGAQWLFLPCAQLGGNAFGYRFIDETCFAGYMLDVAGQGTGAAMHSVAVMNLLRQANPTGGGFDPTDPAGVLTALDEMVRPEDNNGLFFSIWYFVFDLASRELRYASAGSHPAILVAPERGQTRALAAEGPAIGLEFGYEFATHSLQVPAGCMLYLMSNSAVESVQRHCYRTDPECLARLIGAPTQPGIPEPLRLYHAVRAVTGSDAMDQDFSVVAFTF